MKDINQQKFVSLISNTYNFSHRTISKWFPVCLILATSLFYKSFGEFKQTLILPGRPYKIDGVNLGVGRNDSKLRLYGSGTYQGKGFEWSFTNSLWHSDTIYSGIGTHCAPRIAALKNNGINAFYIGEWGSKGVRFTSYSNGWSPLSTLTNSTGKSNIYATRSGNGCNDGKERLYIASDKGLFQYSWNGQSFDEQVVCDFTVGEFSLGDGRNDGTNRIYVGRRYGKTLHEFSWDGTAFKESIVYTAPSNSSWATHVASVRNDTLNRVYAWTGPLMEFTYSSGKWDTLTVDSKNAQRFYIRSGAVRVDKQSRLYVSEKNSGLKEYTWNISKSKFDIDGITAATGGCTIGDGRGDGKNRLYVASGTKNNYSGASVVELSDDSITAINKSIRKKKKASKTLKLRGSQVLQLHNQSDQLIGHALCDLSGKMLWSSIESKICNSNISLLFDPKISNGLYVLQLHWEKTQENYLLYFYR